MQGNAVIGGKPQQKIWIVFTGKTELWWLRFLKKGYRHCFAVLNDGQRWLSVDPLSPYTDIEIYHHIEADFNLPQWLRDQDYIVVQSHINKAQQKPAPFMIYNCVEAMKRLLGLHCRWIVTPWQLYRYLNK